MRKVNKVFVTLALIIAFISILTVKAQAVTISNITFDADYYLNNNADLKNAFGSDSNKAYEHFVTFGIKEGRSASPYFNVRYYLNNYADLKNAFGKDYMSAYNHFISFGIKEGRRGSEYFDVKYYLNENADLKNAFGNDYNSAYNHYINFGIREGRKPSEYFNVICYLNYYQDLRSAFGDKNYYEAAKHYYTFGMKENRVSNHSYTAETVPATCTNSGKVIYKCKCGDVYSEVIPAKGHNLVNVKAVPVTCTTSGNTAGQKCTICGYTTVKDLSATGHKEEVIPGKEATCTEIGLTEGKKCVACNKVLVEQKTIPALGHKMDLKSTTATCVDVGKETYKCSVCGEEEKKDVGALGHSYVENKTPQTSANRIPTCTNSAFVEYICERCGDIKLKYVPKLGHTEEIIPGKEATCTENGLTEGQKCSVCDEILESQEVIPAKGHTVEKISGKEATCTEDGLKEGKKCSVCGETLKSQEVISALGHTEEILPGKIATCLEDGSTEGKHCLRCKEIYVKQEVIPASEKYCKYQNVENVTIYGLNAPTCSEAGWKAEKCTECQNVRLTQVPKHELDYVPAKEPTCTVDGNVEYYKCTECQNKYFRDADGKNVLDSIVVPARHTLGEYKLVSKKELLYKKVCKDCDYVEYYFKDGNGELKKVDSNVYGVSTEDQLKEVLNEARAKKDTYIIYLKNAINYKGDFEITNGSHVIIDFVIQENILTYVDTKPSIISNGSILTFCGNGKIVQNDESFCKGTISVFSPASKSKITFEDMIFKGRGTILYPRGDTAEVNICHSELTTSGVYCIGTNAGNENNYGVKIDISDNSKLYTTSTKEKDGDNCPVMINVRGTLSIDNCEIIGERMGVLVRAGTADIKNTAITVNGNFSGDRDLGKWDGGNEVSRAGLIVGHSGNETSYLANAICNLDHVTIDVSNASNKEDDNYFIPQLCIAKGASNATSNGNYSTEVYGAVPNWTVKVLYNSTYGDNLKLNKKIINKEDLKTTVEELLASLTTTETN